MYEVHPILNKLLYALPNSFSVGLRTSVLLNKLGIVIWASAHMVHPNLFGLLDTGSCQS